MPVQEAVTECLAKWVEHAHHDDEGFGFAELAVMEIGHRLLASLGIESVWALHNDVRDSFGAHYVREAIERAPTTNPAKRRAVFERDGYVCKLCGASENLEVDHIHPRALGGDDGMANLQTLCKTCNVRKGSRV